MSYLIRSQSAFLVVLAAALSAEASEAVKLLPAEADVVVTLNLREMLHDLRGNEYLQQYLEQFRLAVKGDEKLLRQYYQGRELRKFEGISEQDFLERAGMIKSLTEKLAIDLFEDIDRVTLGLKIGNSGFTAVIVEGRFRQEKFNAGLSDLKPLLKQALGVADDGDGPRLTLLNGKTVAFADSKKTMDALHGKTAGLPPSMRRLLDGSDKAQVAVAIGNVEALVQMLVKHLKNDVARWVKSDDLLGKLLVTQGVDWLEKNGGAVAGAGIGVSLVGDEVRLQIGLDLTKLETCRDLRARLIQGNFWTAVALKALNNKLTSELANIVIRQRVTGTDPTIVLHAHVPVDFIKQVAKGPLDLPPQTPFLDGLFGQVTSIPLWTAPIAADSIVELRGIAYRDGPGADPFRHRLDVYLPRNKKNFPVVVLVHGGSWVIGDNRSAGLYAAVGQFLASQGIGTVMPNYRLSPAAKHPEHVKDVARAVAWTRANIGKHGGDVNRFFIMGHSAGVHLVSLLATDESYLQAEGMKVADIKGVIPVSGLYHIPDGMMYANFGGLGPRAMRIEQSLPARGDSGTVLKLPLPGLPIQLNMFGPVFGDSVKVRAQASPVTHVRRGLPPFLIFCAEHDLPTLPEMADDFHEALRREGCDARLIKMAQRNHDSLMFSVITPADPTARAILEFISKNEK